MQRATLRRHAPGNAVRISRWPPMSKARRRSLQQASNSQLWR
jgi:hypothetical protein